MPRLFGRHPVLADETAMTRENILSAVDKALECNADNERAANYLWNYYKGDQPILYRVKKVRPEINNRIVENRAHEIVTFKTGYLCGEPIQYVAANSDEGVSDGISALNRLMESISKDALDRSLAEWFHVCGTAYRLCLPRKPSEEHPAPFDLYTLDPRQTAVVYSRGIEHKKLLGLCWYYDEDNVKHITAYSDKMKWEIEGEKLTEEPHAYGCVPIFEYPANAARLGAFEPVIPLLDELNNLGSNRMDGIEQHVQAFMKFINCVIDEETYQEFLEKGRIMVTSRPGVNADVDLISNDLDQSQSQVTKDDIYNAILTITGMPNRNGGSSTSDTGAAVIYRDGWSNAESRAKDTENMMRPAERELLSFILRICRSVEGAPEEIGKLKLTDITMKFTRRNYENIQTKAQVLDLLLKNPKVHPLQAYQMCGALPDPESACKMGLDWYNEQTEKEAKALDDALKRASNAQNSGEGEGDV